MKYPKKKIDEEGLEECKADAKERSSVRQPTPHTAASEAEKAWCWGTVGAVGFAG